MPIWSSKGVIELTLKALASLTNEENFEIFYDTTVKKAKKHNFVKDPWKTTKKKASNLSVEQYFDDTESSVDAYNTDIWRA